MYSAPGPVSMARPEGVEPPTSGLEGRCSIQLSYGRFSNSFVQLRVSKGARTLNPRIHSPVLYRLSYTPRTPTVGAPGGNRTPDLRLRRPTLYPSELRALNSYLHEASRERTPRSASSPSTVMSKIGAAGFGPATSCAQGRRATRLRYAPELRWEVWHPPFPRTRLPSVSGGSRQGRGSAPPGPGGAAGTRRRGGRSRPSPRGRARPWSSGGRSPGSAPAAG